MSDYPSNATPRLSREEIERIYFDVDHGNRDGPTGRELRALCDTALSALSETRLATDCDCISMDLCRGRDAVSPWMCRRDKLKDAAPQVPAMVTSGASGQNVEADRAHAGREASTRALCDERLAGVSSPASAALTASPPDVASPSETALLSSAASAERRTPKASDDPLTLARIVVQFHESNAEYEPEVVRRIAQALIDADAELNEPSAASSGALKDKLIALVEEWDEQPSGEALLAGKDAVLDFLHMPEVEALFAAPAARRTFPEVPLDLWQEICDFIDDHVDVRDGSDGAQLPNAAMLLTQRIQAEVNTRGVSATGRISVPVGLMQEAAKQLQWTTLSPRSLDVTMEWVQHSALVYRQLSGFLRAQGGEANAADSKAEGSK